MHETGVLLHPEKFGDSDAAGHRDPRQVVTHQVDDHDVLGNVLVLEEFSARCRSLDGAGGKVRSTSTEEEFRAGRHNIEAQFRYRDESLVGCRILAHQSLVQGPDIPMRLGGKHATEVHLIDVARGDVILDATHPACVRVLIQRRGPTITAGPTSG
jgi:hypothetical protein